MTARLSSRTLGSIALLCLLTAPAAPTSAGPLPDQTDQPILVIGASYADGRLPFNGAAAPFGGSSVGFGSFLSVGDALVRVGKFVINEGQAGATTFGRNMCLPDVCLPVGWQGYDEQLQRAVSRVAIPNPADPTQIVGYNAQYVYIGMSNDCLHSGSFDVPGQQTSPCSQSEIDAMVDRLIDVGEDAMDLGLVPIYPEYPDYANIDLSIQAAATGLLWYVDESQWNQIADTYRERITDELPGAIMVDSWKNFQSGPDGLHPTPLTSQKAARRIRKAIEDYEAACE